MIRPPAVYNRRSWGSTKG